MARPRAQSFRDLIVWQKAGLLVRAVYALCGGLPANEQYALASQLKRAALSVQSNIAEGWGRATRRELHRFATIARGSVNELDSLLDNVESLGFPPTQALTDARALAIEVGKMLTALRASLRR